MSTEVLTPTEAVPDCVSAEEEAPSCVDPTEAVPTCVEAATPELTFFLDSDPETPITEVDFGSVPIGQATDVNVICRNTGGLTLNLCDFLIEGEGFSYQDLPEDTELEPGEEVIVVIRFLPTE